MRISTSGVDPSDVSVPYTFDGEPMEGLVGDTVAAALIDSGIVGLRQATTTDERGVFCGMGVCTECAVVIDGVAGQLACMTPLTPNATIDRQPHLTPLPSIPAPALPETELSPDLLVVGGGAAGLAAATVAATAGLDVVLIEERSKLGGQFYKQPPAASSLDEERLDGQYAEGRRLISAAAEAGVTVLLGVRVWAAFSASHVVASGSDQRYAIRPKRLVVASGAYERGVPMPGWTLPGVMTTGAAQTLLRGNQVSPGTRVLVAGNGPLNLQVAAEMASAGVSVVGLAEVADVRWWRGMTAGAAMTLNAPGLVRRGIGYRATLMRFGVPVMPRSSLIALEGDGSVARATVARLDANGYAIAGSERHFEVDAVTMGYGFLPANDLSRALGCEHQFDASKGHLVTTRTPSGRTTIDDVWVIGDASGIAGAHVAVATGTIAGAEISEDLGRRLGAAVTDRVASAHKQLRRHRRFQRHLWKLYGGPVLTDQLATADTIICRCETVTHAHVTTELDDNTTTAGSLKRKTRAGMGRCQGRYCGPVLSAIVARSSGIEIDAYSGFAPQPPARPTEVALMAQPEEPTDHRSPNQQR